MVDLSRLALVVLAAVAVWALALASAWRLARRAAVRRLLREVGPEVAPKLAERRKTPSRFVRGAEIAVLAAAGLTAVAALDAFVEPYRPEVTRHRVRSSRLRGPGPIRVVQLSDVHSGPVPRTEARLPALVAQQHPDLIVFTGDAVNERGGVPVFRQLMTALAEIAPTFAVRGNWDVWWFGDADLFGGTGVRELTGEAEPLRVRGDELWLVGAAVDAEAELSGALATVPEGRFTLLLHHFPAALAELGARAPDLFLAGDTHGGQLWLPGLGELVRISRAGHWQPMGIAARGRTTVYVHRGIGMEGRQPPVRLFCRPEIAVFDLVPE